MNKTMMNILFVGLALEMYICLMVSDENVA